MKDEDDLALPRSRRPARASRQDQQRRERPLDPPTGIHAFAWQAWPVMNWLLPLFVVFHAAFGGGGKNLWMPLYLAPVLVPVSWLLGNLPRFILRKRGGRTLPAPMTWLLFLQWWCCVVIAMTMPAEADGEPQTSLLQSLFGRMISDGCNLRLFFTAAWLVALSWAALVVLAGVRRSWSDARFWTTVAWAGAFLVPGFILVAAVIGALMPTP